MTAPLLRAFEQRLPPMENLPPVVPRPQRERERVSNIFKRRDQRKGHDFRRRKRAQRAILTNATMVQEDMRVQYDRGGKEDPTNERIPEFTAGTERSWKNMTRDRTTILRPAKVRSEYTAIEDEGSFSSSVGTGKIWSGVQPETASAKEMRWMP